MQEIDKYSRIEYNKYSEIELILGQKLSEEI